MGFIGKKKLIPTVSFLLEKTFQIFIFLIPSQLALHFWPKWAFVYGIRIDYLAPTLYLSDILILTIFFLWLIDISLNRYQVKFKNLGLYLVPLLILIFLNIIFTTNYYLAIYKWLKLLELAMLCVFVVQYRKIEIKKWIFKPLAFSIIFFVIIGMLQFIHKGTIGGAFYILGERAFSIYTPGIALVDIFGRQFMRAYSTFPHPNSLAGFLGISILLFLLFGKSLNRRLYYLVIVFAFLGIVISFSRTVIFTLCVTGIFWFLINNKKKEIMVGKLTTILLIITSILLLGIKTNFITSKINNVENIYQRISLIKTSGEMIKEHPIFGVGLGNFIKNIPKYSKDNSWLLQPVHNIYLLIFAETGLMGLVIFFILSIRILNKTLSFNKRNFIYLLLFVLLTGFFDHYWITIQQNLLLEVLIFAMILREDIKFT